MKKSNTTIAINFELGFIESIIAQRSNDEMAAAIMASGADLGIVLKGALGYNSPQEFKTGSKVYCTQRIWDYSTEESKKKSDSVQREMGEVTILEFDKYKNHYSVEHIFHPLAGDTIKKRSIVPADTLMLDFMQ
jgi:hypothetical protein